MALTVGVHFKEAKGFNKAKEVYHLWLRETDYLEDGSAECIKEAWEDGKLLLLVPRVNYYALMED